MRRSLFRPRGFMPLAPAGQAALILARCIAVTTLEAFIVDAAFANAVRNRDRCEIPRRRDGGSEHDQQQCRNGRVTHSILPPAAARIAVVDDACGIT